MYLESSRYSRSAVHPTQSKRRRFAVKLAIVIAAVALAAFGMVIPAKHLTQVPGTEAESSVSVGAVSAEHPAVEETSMAPTEQPRPLTWNDDAKDPRECEPAKGVTSACIFE